MLADALLHLVEGAGGLNDFDRAGLWQGRAVRVFPQGVGRLSQARQRPGREAHRQPGNQADTGDQGQ